MEKWKVVNMFCDLISHRRKVIEFSRGYDVFEEVYNEFINGAVYLDNKKFNLQRKEDGIMSIITFEEV